MLLTNMESCTRECFSKKTKAAKYTLSRDGLCVPFSAVVTEISNTKYERSNLMWCVGHTIIRDTMRLWGNDEKLHSVEKNKKR